MSRFPRFRIRVRTLLVLVAGCAVLLGGARLYQWLTANVEENAWVGWSQGEIMNTLGLPTESYGKDSRATNAMRPANPSAAPWRALYYKTPRGDLWVWLRLVNGRWVCVRSLWSSDRLRIRS